MANPALFSAALIIAKTALDAATSFTTIGTVPTGHIASFVCVNNSIADITLSMDNGTTTHFLVPAGSIRGWNFTELNLRQSDSITIKYKNLNSTTTNTNDRLSFEFVRSS